MKRRSIRTLGLAIAAFACLFAVSAGSAFGAGKPSGVITYFEPGLNYMTVEAGANPNGASTTLNIQYSAVGKGEWHTLASKNIGAGTETQYFSGTLAPVWLGQKTEYRAVAENSFGSTSSPGEKEGFRLKVWQSGITEDTATYSSSGKISISDYAAGGFNNIECNASGNGEFGPEAVGGAHLKLSLSGCVWYNGASVRCNPKVSFEPMSFSAEYALPSAEVLFRCPEEEVMHVLRYSGRFLTTLGSSTSAYWFPSVEQPVTMVGSGTIDARTATLTVSSSWALTGSNKGKKFFLQEM